MAFLVWNAPPSVAGAFPERPTVSSNSHMLSAIAFAGTMGNARLFQLLAQLGGSRTVA